MCSDFDSGQAHPWVTKDGADPMMRAEDNCATLVEPPTEAEMDEAITGNIMNLIVVMKAVKRFKKLLMRKRPQFMDGIFGRESRIVAPPHQVHGDSVSVESSDRRPIDSTLATEGVHRDMDEDLVKAPADMARMKIRSPTMPDSVAGADGTNEPEDMVSDDDDPHVGSLPLRARTFPVDEHAKGHAHDPLKDRLFLNIGAGADMAENGDALGDPVVCESPGGVEDDIYEAAYQEEIKRIIAERAEASIHLTRRVEHIERLRKHPNVISSSLNHAFNFADSSARKLQAQARAGGLAALVRDARDKARATVAEAERSSSYDLSPSGTPTKEEDNLSVNTRTSSGLDGTTDSPTSTRQSSRSPQPPAASETFRLRDYAKASASQALRGVARRLDGTAHKLDARGNIQPYPET